MHVSIGDTVRHNGRPFYVHGIYSADIVDGWYDDEDGNYVGPRARVPITELTPLVDPHRYWLVLPDHSARVSGPYDSWEAANTDRRGADLLIEEDK